MSNSTFSHCPRCGERLFGQHECPKGIATAAASQREVPGEVEAMISTLGMRAENDHLAAMREPINSNMRVALLADSAFHDKLARLLESLTLAKAATERERNGYRRELDGWVEANARKARVLDPVSRVTEVPTPNGEGTQSGVGDE